jgi:peroxiredoxin
MRAPRGVTRPPAALLAAALTIAAACGGGRDATPAASASGTPGAVAADTTAFRPLAVGDPAPDYAVRTLAGAEARVGAPGEPVTLVNVWATWCTSCREEMGDLAALHREFAPRGLRVLAVSVDQAPEARVRRFAERERLPFAVAHDPEARAQDAFRVVGVPETYLVGADGRVRWRRAGNVHGVLGEARGAVAAALAARPATPAGR